MHTPAFRQSLRQENFQPRLQNEFRASLRYMVILCVKREGEREAETDRQRER